MVVALRAIRVVCHRLHKSGPIDIKGGQLMDKYRRTIALITSLASWSDNVKPPADGKSMELRNQHGNREFSRLRIFVP